jgi:hypothetical protein
VARFRDVTLDITSAERKASRTGLLSAHLEVVNSPVGEWSGAIQIPVLTFEQLDVLEDLVREPETTRPELGGTAGRAYAATCGQGLFDATVGRWGMLAWARDKVREQNLDGIRLRIRSDSPVVSAQPWELLYSADDAAFLALQSDISIVREPVRVGASPTAQVPHPLRVLLVGAAPSDQGAIEVERELRELKSLLEGFRDAVEVHAIVPATFEAMRTTLRDEGPWHVVHFSGHGDFDRKVGSMVIFEKPDRTSDAIGGEALAAALSGRSETRLVVINACRGSMGASRGIVNPLARTLMGQGLPAVIAMQFEVTDRAAIPFAASFYRMLIATGDVEAALGEARTTISLTALYGNESPIEMGALRCLEWCTPVMHLDADSGLLFDPDTTDLPVAPNLDAVLPTPLRSDEVRIRQVERLKWELSFASHGRSPAELLDEVERTLRDTLDVRTLNKAPGRIESKVGGVFGAFIPGGLGATELIEATVQAVGRITQVRVTSRSWNTILDQGRNEAHIRKLAARLSDLAK